MIHAGDRSDSDPSTLPAISSTVDRPGSATSARNPKDQHNIEQSHPAGNIPQPSMESRQDARTLGPSLALVWKWGLVFLSPTTSLAYLVFCYVVHYRVVVAEFPNLSAGTTQFLTELGAGLTTVNIVIISLVLFPLKGLLSDLQSEEFFRLLSANKDGDSRNGIRLSEVNGISTLSYGLVDSIMVILHRRCSRTYTMAFLAAIIIWTTSTLAPAALSTQPILVDGSIMAFPVGAIPPLSLYQPVPGGQTVLPATFSPAPGYSAAIVWAEREIGLSYSYSVLDDLQGTFSGFAVPIPPMLNSTNNARWLTDVIGFNPHCTWANPVNLSAASLNTTVNNTVSSDPPVSVYLEDHDLQVLVPYSYFPAYNSFFVTSINVHDPTATVFNYTTGSLPTDGAMIASVIQCISTDCTKEAIDIISLFVSLESIPSMRFSSVGANYSLAFLVCKPNITIETREIRTKASMTLEVQPLSKGAPPFPRQGNLDWTQTSLLVAYSMSKLSTDSGPSSSEWNGLGSGTQANFIFGSDQMNAVPSGVNFENTTQVLYPLPIDQLARGYTQMVKAAMKPYVSGSLGTSYVPGRLASVQQIFVSSLPHAIASTILFFLLFVIAVIAQFRSEKGDQFDLTTVATVLAGSALPKEVEKVKLAVIAEGRPKENQSRWRVVERNIGQEVARRIGEWKVFLEPSPMEDGVKVLHTDIPTHNQITRDAQA